MLCRLSLEFADKLFKDATATVPTKIQALSRAPGEKENPAQFCKLTVPLTDQEEMWERQVNFKVNSSNLSFREDGLVELVNKPTEVKQHMGQDWTPRQCYLPARYSNVVVHTFCLSSTAEQLPCSRYSEALRWIQRWGKQKQFLFSRSFQSSRRDEKKHILPENTIEASERFKVM